ncbi:MULTISPECIES: hypothetical protein [Empedobacter]|uniref:Uncharacterized protein n=1 Tax=Empedobacter falsenii TaxID=343874 RepID=A0A7H9DSY1_9FLAO|nr:MULTISPECIES: hypothetical protein [Empedobacter]MDH2208654.1 hypothetical protein [Empedobacter sp. GD03644]QLL57839.1 hypothetical protein FH779_07000 [Empedobacter falsenii]
MRRVLFLFLDHFSSTYLLLFCFFCSIYVNAYNVEIKERDDSIPTISKGLVTIKENTTFYISKNTIISNCEIKDSINHEKNIKKRKSKEKIKRKNTNNSNLKKSRNNSYDLSTLINKKICYLPYKESTFFISSKSILLALYTINSFNIIIFYSNSFNKNYEPKIKLKLSTYNYIFCDYAICLSHLEIRSPSLFS